VQRLLSEQTFEVLAGLGYRDAVGYDSRGYTRLLGALPAGQVEKLLEDLRASDAGKKQPAPFARALAIRRIEARPDLPTPAGRMRPPLIPRGQEKISPDLRAVITNASRAEKATLLEVILTLAPDEEDISWRNPLVDAAPGLTVEGRLGPLVTVVARPSQAPALAQLPRVAGVRLPRTPAPVQMAQGPQDVRWRPLRATGLERLHALGHKGAGMNLAVIADDFRGWEKEVGKRLPRNTTLLDLTRERNPDLQPDPFPTAGPAPGLGTRHALAITEAAPAVRLTLLRVDPSCPYMLQQIARAINGDLYQSISLDNRRAQLDLEKALLDQRREALLEERRVVMSNFEQEGELAKARADYVKKQAEFDREVRAYADRLDRYLEHEKALQALRSVRLVACTFTWNEGYPVDGSSTLSRYLDDRPFRAALWFQAAGDTRGQTWSGLFRDEDDNRVMEFVPFDRPPPAGGWTPELNFLSWRDTQGKQSRDFPAGVRIRLALQWQEAHNPLYLRTGEDAYRTPLFRPLLVLIAQPDPEGKKQPADDLQMVALSAPDPQRLNASATSAVYEQILEVTLPRAGRYAVRIEGRAPASTDPLGAPSVPAARRWSDLRLRLYVATLAGPGRAVWQDFVTEVGSLGMPADAQAAIVVGAASARDEQQAYSANGPPFNQELRRKMVVLAYDQGQGTARAACFAAGLLATVCSAQPKRPQPCHLPWAVSTRTVLRIDDDWPNNR
jgi:hypothetical protein